MKKGKILIIDDEEQLRSLVKRIVALEGFTMVEVPICTMQENFWNAAKLMLFSVSPPRLILEVLKDHTVKKCFAIPKATRPKLPNCSELT